MKIMIATPAYGGEVTTTYCDALLWLYDHFREKHPHIRFQHKFLSLSVLPFMRNLYASLVMQDESYTHLLFVDADMGFAPSLIEHMIAADKPVVGAMSSAPQVRSRKALRAARRDRGPCRRAAGGHRLRQCRRDRFRRRHDQAGRDPLRRAIS